MEVEVSQTENCYVVSLSGDLLEEARDVFAKELNPILGERSKAVLLDISGTKYINSAGLGNLVSLVARANTYGCRIVLVSPSPFVAGVLKTTKLNTFFAIAQDMKQAEDLLN